MHPDERTVFPELQSSRRHAVRYRSVQKRLPDERQNGKTEAISGKIRTVRCRTANGNDGRTEKGISTLHPDERTVFPELQSNRRHAVRYRSVQKRLPNEKTDRKEGRKEGRKQSPAKSGRCGAGRQTETTDEQRKKNEPSRAMIGRCASSGRTVGAPPSGAGEQRADGCRNRAGTFRLCPVGPHSRFRSQCGHA